MRKIEADLVFMTCSRSRSRELGSKDADRVALLVDRAVERYLVDGSLEGELVDSSSSASAGCLGYVDIYTFSSRRSVFCEIAPDIRPVSALHATRDS